MQELFCLFQLRLLGFQIQFRFLLAHLQGLDLNGILQLHVGAGLIPVTLQFADLNLVVIHTGAELLPLQIQLVRSQLQLVRIVGKEGVPLFHILAFLNQQFRHILIRVLFDFGNVLRNHHTGEALSGTDSRKAGHLLHIYGSLFLAASADTGRQTKRQAQYDHFLKSHICILPQDITFVLSIIRKAHQKVNCPGV